MTPEHSPSPWTYFAGDNYAGASMKFFVAANRQGFAHTVGLSEPIDTANANLIAVAPDLLAALKELVEACASDDKPVTFRALIAANKAIAKAEGREVPA